MADCCADPNPDITGVAIRSILYAQALLAWLVAWIWPFEYATWSSMAHLTAIGLVITAFIRLQTQLGSLSLVDGIVVSLITTMMMTCNLSFQPLGKIDRFPYPQDPDLDQYIPIIWPRLILITFWTAWCINLWKNPYQFGVSPECENKNPDVMIVLFGHKLHATSRNMQIAALVLTCIGAFISFLSLLISHLNGELVNSACRFIWGDSRPDDRPEKEHKLVRYTRIILNPLIFGALVSLIVVTEQTIKENDSEHPAAQWSCSQAIALFMLLEPFMGMYSRMSERRNRQRHPKGNEMSERAIAEGDFAEQDSTTGSTEAADQPDVINWPAPALPVST